MTGQTYDWMMMPPRTGMTPVDPADRQGTTQPDFVVSKLSENKDLAGHVSVEAATSPNMIPAIGPADFPTRLNTPPDPVPASPDAPLVAVVDTGLVADDRLPANYVGRFSRADAAKWGAAIAPDPISADGGTAAYMGAGHGTFIAGVLAQANANIQAYNALAEHTPYMTDRSVVATLDAAVKDGADVVVCSFGSYTDRRPVPDRHDRLHPHAPRRQIRGRRRQRRHRARVVPGGAVSPARPRHQHRRHPRLSEACEPLEPGQVGRGMGRGHPQPGPPDEAHVPVPERRRNHLQRRRRHLVEDVVRHASALV